MSPLTNRMQPQPPGNSPLFTNRQRKQILSLLSNSGCHSLWCALLAGQYCIGENVFYFLFLIQANKKAEPHIKKNSTVPYFHT
ncbi:hypothetical protein CEXT_443911 [Caerostris extrusa]|uniref:Uncharacterized protein n=1 Tax=Caerostris extrusa TaxID=172846 RepID=A0AAV4N4D6_CAEEX|nr:hypothetical protein CEXT_443911 [Caerostris extrusa]